jgi:hypothetical protein
MDYQIIEFLPICIIGLPFLGAIYEYVRLKM